jgi:hypothetical protein
MQETSGNPIINQKLTPIKPTVNATNRNNMAITLDITALEVRNFEKKYLDGWGSATVQVVAGEGCFKRPFIGLLS